MLITQDNGGGRLLVKAYEPGAIRINQHTYHRGVMLTTQELLQDDLPTDIDELKEEHIHALLNSGATVLLLGSGPRQRFLATPLMKIAYEKGFNIEVMDSRAAAHTFVVLASEGRKVAALILP